METIFPAYGAFDKNFIDKYNNFKSLFEVLELGKAMRVFININSILWRSFLRYSLHDCCHLNDHSRRPTEILLIS